VTTRVIGWYHSHPHITVLPSAVGTARRGTPCGAERASERASAHASLCRAADVRTQSTYQLLDEGFVGLIFSVFDQDQRDKVRSCSCASLFSALAPPSLRALRAHAFSLLAARCSLLAQQVSRVQVIAFQAEAARASEANAWLQQPAVDAGGLTHRLVPLRVVPSQQFSGAWRGWRLHLRRCRIHPDAASCSC
jgi:hypothetical protein